MFTPGGLAPTGPPAGSPTPPPAYQPAARKTAGLFSPDPNVHLFDRLAIIIKHWKAAVAIAAVGLYLIDVIGESWSKALPLARLLPFHYYHGAAILRGTANAALDLSILAGVGVAGIALAYWQFGRRDL